MATTFAQFGLPEPIVRSLNERGLQEPFPVQAASIPDALAGRDVSCKAPTGSGKTLAFGLPLLARLERGRPDYPRALVLAPTRELADQISQELAPLASSVGRRALAVYGGVGYRPQKSALRRGVDLLVATPGRLEDLSAQGAVDLGEAGIVVVDEADRMADMGFLPAVKRILDATAQERQTLLFSATLDRDVAVLSRRYQRDPVQHEAGSAKPEAGDARHHFWLVDHHDRPRHAADLVEATGRTIVFTRTRHGADRLAKQLGKLDIDAIAIHGGRTQGQRCRALSAFASGKAAALVATDVAARGIHVDAVASVLHFDPPGSSKDYLHRSGRTARAGASGTVVSLVMGEQRRDVRRIQRDLGLHEPIEAPNLDAIRLGGHHVRPTTAQTASPPVRPFANGRRTMPAAATESVYVANLPWKTTADEVEKLFAQHGRVHQATIIADRRTGRSKGFGFLDMPATAVATAIEALHGTEFGGRQLVVRVARPRRDRR